MQWPSQEDAGPRERPSQWGVGPDGYREGAFGAAHQQGCGHEQWGSGVPDYSSSGYDGYSQWGSAGVQQRPSQWGVGAPENSGTRPSQWGVGAPDAAPRERPSQWGVGAPEGGEEVGGQSSSSGRPSQWGVGAPSDKLPAGSKLQGTVKSFSAVKGFGFIICDEVNQDIWFARDSLEATLRTSDLAGHAATFELYRTPDGKPQARHITVLPNQQGAVGGLAGAAGSGMGSSTASSTGGGCSSGCMGGGMWSGSNMGGMGGMPGAGMMMGCMGAMMGKGMVGGMCGGPGAMCGAGMMGKGMFPMRPPGMFPMRPGAPVPGMVARPMGFAGPTPGGEAPRGPAVEKKRAWSPHAGARAIREAMRSETAEEPKKEEPKSEDESSSRSRSRTKSKDAKGKRKRSSSGSRSSRSSSSSSSRSRGKKKKKEKKSSSAAENAASDNAEINEAKKDALQKLMDLKEIESKDTKIKEWRKLLRQWHPDKNPEKKEVATAVFQFLQKGKAVLKIE